MVNIGLLILCFVLGIVLRQSGRLPENAPAALNGFGLWNVLVLALMLIAYGYPIAQFVIDPSPGAMVHRMH